MPGSRSSPGTGPSGPRVQVGAGCWELAGARGRGRIPGRGHRRTCTLLRYDGAHETRSGSMMPLGVGQPYPLPIAG